MNSTVQAAKSAMYWGDMPPVADRKASPDLERLHAAIDWLCRSMDATPVDGSSVCFKLYGGWANAYPETTGYIIATLFRYASLYHKPEIAERATRMARWITTLQQDNGALPGGDYKPGTTRPASVFNSGQMIIGLIAAFEETQDQQFLDVAARAAQWLASEQDDTGAWSKHAYRSGFSPSYYSRVCWPMLMTVAHTGDEAVRAAAGRGLDFIASKLQANHAILDWGFAPDKPAFTHTIAYTIRGFLEADRLEPGHQNWVDAGQLTAEKVFRIFELRKRIAGAYDPNWKGSNWYVCLTGNCQLAICWMRLFDVNGDARLVNAACKAIDIVSRNQPLNPLLIKPLKGGIPGSSPIFGRYLTLRYPNWAAKFYADALMMRDDRLAKIERHPPGAA